MLSKDEQDAHLFGLISLRPPQRRRPRVTRNNESGSDSSIEDNNNIDRMKPFSNNAVYSYKIRADGNEHPVCFKAFLSIFGVTRSRIRRLQNNLLLQGKSLNDRRGKHSSRFKKISDPVLNLITSHIQSFKARQSHYSRRKNPDRLYLPETLSIKSMYKMFLEKYRINVSYKIYWTVFTSLFNIKFGLPRSDTCTVCDRLLSKLNSSTNLEERQSIEQKEIFICVRQISFTR